MRRGYEPLLARDPVSGPSSLRDKLKPSASTSASEQVTPSNGAREDSTGLPGRDVECFMLKGFSTERLRAIHRETSANRRKSAWGDKL